MTRRSYQDYVNADGLRLRYGRGASLAGRAGSFRDHQGRTVVEVDLIGTELKAYDDATDPTTVLSFETRIPPSVFIHRAEFQVTTDFVGSSATLTIGLVDASDMEAAFTDYDPNGFDDTIAVTALQTADTMPIVCDGDLISEAVGSDAGGYLISAEAGTADFSAGAGKLTIWYGTLPATGD